MLNKLSAKLNDIFQLGGAKTRRSKSNRKRRNLKKRNSKRRSVTKKNNRRTKRRSLRGGFTRCGGKKEPQQGGFTRCGGKKEPQQGGYRKHKHDEHQHGGFYPHSGSLAYSGYNGHEDFMDMYYEPFQVKVNNNENK